MPSTTWPGGPPLHIFIGAWLNWKYQGRRGSLIERLGHRLLVRSRSLERLHAKAAEFSENGVTRKGEILKIDGFYTAVFYDRSGRIEP